MTTTIEDPAIFAQPDPADLLARFNEAKKFVKLYCIDRNEDIDLMFLSVIAAIDGLFLGDPGAGKTWQIELMVNHVLVADDGSSLGDRLFTHLCAKDQSANEILGGTDIMALKQGKTARVTTGMLPEAVFAYLDEVFKASPPLLNPLLDIGAKRELKVGGKVMDCSQLLTIFYSSNELPDREDLMAFRDRIAWTKFVEPIKSPEGRREVSKMQLNIDANGFDTTGVRPLKLSEVHAIRQLVKQVQVPDGIIDIMGEIEQQCLEAKHPISQRRKRDIWKMVKAAAWARGGDSVRSDDFMIAEHMLWNLASDAESAHNIVVSHANQFVRRAAAIEAELEPIMKSMDELKVQIDTATSADEKGKLQRSGYDFITDLQAVIDKTRGYIREGEREGQDVGDLKEALKRVKKFHSFTIGQLTGTGDNGDDEDED